MGTSSYEKYQRAKKQVREIKGFYTHLFIYVFVLALLAYVNLRYTPEYLWFIWSMLGWGIGLLFHAIRVFQWFPFLGKDWEKRKIQEFMEEDRNNKMNKP